MSLIDAAAAVDTKDAVFDVRSAAVFEEGHLPGAFCVVSSEWEEALKRPDYDRLDQWQERLGALGFDGKRNVVVYDDGAMAAAARVWLVLSALGIPTRVVNGGWLAIEQVPRMRVEVGLNKRPAVTFAAPTGKGADRASFKTRTALRDGLASVQVLDVRTPAEYAGEDQRNNKRPGHIPGSINVDSRQLMAKGGGIRPAAELKALLGDAGLKQQPEIVTLCQGGGRAAVAALAAASIGYPKVAVYYPSYGDWSKDETCPVTKP